MSYLFLLIYLLVFSFLLTRWQWVKDAKIPTFWLLILFLIKVIAGFSLTYLYTHYYDKSTSDIYIYFNDAHILKSVFQKDFFLATKILTGFYNEKSELVHQALANTTYWDTNTSLYAIWGKRLLIRINTLWAFISFGNIYIHSLLMSFLGFVGLVALYRFIKNNLAIQRQYLVFIVFLLPTPLLWTSSILKEPLVFLSMGLLLYHLDKFLRFSYLPNFIYLFFFGFLLFVVKPYILFVLLFPIFLFVLYTYKRTWNFLTQTKVFALLSLLIVGFAFTLYISGNYNIFKKIADKQAAFYENITIAEKTKKVGSIISMEKLEPTASSVLKNMPQAFYNVLLKPSILDYKKPTYLLDILQNLFLIFLSLFAVFRFHRLDRKEYPFVWLTISFVLLLYLLIGLTVPVLGAIVRYKIPAFIFLMVLLLRLVSKKQI